MDISTRLRIPTTLAAALCATAALTLVPGTAQASRLPADPLTFVPAPITLTRLVITTQATNVWAALRDVHAG